MANNIERIDSNYKVIIMEESHEIMSGGAYSYSDKLVSQQKELQDKQSLSMLNNIVDLSKDMDSSNAQIEINKVHFDTKILKEETKRIGQIEERIVEEARLDGKIDTEEKGRIDAVSSLKKEQENYTDTVKKALIDGEISDAEMKAIQTAQEKVDAAKDELQEKLEESDSKHMLAQLALGTEISNEESARIIAIAEENEARTEAIQERVLKEALLDGRIDKEEEDRLKAAEELKVSQENYTDTVKKALIDGEISDAEQNAISEAQKKVDAAQDHLQGNIDKEVLQLNENLNSEKDRIIALEQNPVLKIRSGKVFLDVDGSEVQIYPAVYS